MNYKTINPTGKSYSQACDITNFGRLVFVSGQIPETNEGIVPVTFEEQCRLALENIGRQLQETGLELRQLIKVAVFLSDRQYREADSRIRQEILGAIPPALTIIITGIYDEKWLLEIEAIAAE